MFLLLLLSFHIEHGSLSALASGPDFPFGDIPLCIFLLNWLHFAYAVSKGKLSENLNRGL